MLLPGLPVAGAAWVLCGAAVRLAERAVGLGGLPVILVAALVAGIATPLLAWGLWFDADDRERLRQMLLRKRTGPANDGARDEPEPEAAPRGTGLGAEPRRRAG